MTAGAVGGRRSCRLHHVSKKNFRCRIRKVSLRERGTIANLYKDQVPFYSHVGPRMAAQYGKFTETAPLKADAKAEPVAPKAWRHSLCGCMSDCCVCCAVCCCQWITIGQIFERGARAGVIERTCGLGCLSIVLILLFLSFVQTMLQGASVTFFDDVLDVIAYLQNATSPEATQAIIDEHMPTTEASVTVQAAQLCGFIASLLTCLIICSVRKGIRKRDEIPADCCPDCCDDCCCAAFCI